MYKISNYVIFQEFHDIKDNFQKIVAFSTRTSSLKLLDKATYSILKKGKFLKLEKNILDALIKDKFVF